MDADGLTHGYRESQRFWSRRKAYRAMGHASDTNRLNQRREAAQMLKNICYRLSCLPGWGYPAIHCWLGIHSRFVTFLASESRVTLHLFRFEILMLCLLWYVETAQNHVAPKSGLYLHSSPCLHARMSVFKLHIDHMIFISDAASSSSLLTHHSQFSVPPWRIIPWIIGPIGLASK